MEAQNINGKLHNTIRIEIKKRLYIRCLKIQPEMAREKMPLLDKSRVNIVPYIWNSSIEGDELLQVSLKELKSEQIKDAATELMT